MALIAGIIVAFALAFVLDAFGADELVALALAWPAFLVTAWAVVTFWDKGPSAGCGAPR